MRISALGDWPVPIAQGPQVRTWRLKKLQRPRLPMLVPAPPNELWSVDFMSDQLAIGRRFRIPNIFDTSISGQRLARFLDELGQTALPKVLVCDNGSQLTSKAMFFRSQRSGPKLHFIQPGKPMQNAFVGSFNGPFRDNRLNEYWFKDLADARQSIDAGRHHYNHVRPHSSLGCVPPVNYARQAA